ncbi:MAG: magnesium chelatase, partial [Corynebacterium casei]|nr:magnesium chelatase [Corynebacterium casei]
MKKLVTAVMVFLSGIILVACGSMGGIFDFGLNFGGVGGGSGDGDDGASSSADPLVIAAATELEDLEPAIAVASADLGFDIQMEFPDGTLANTQQLAQGNID